MSRITRRINGTDIIEFVDGKGFAKLTHEETVRLLFKTLAETEDKLEEADRLEIALHTHQSYDKTASEFHDEAERYRKALNQIVCLNIPMPDQVFEIANNALENEN